MNKEGDTMKFILLLEFRERIGFDTPISSSLLSLVLTIPRPISILKLLLEFDLLEGYTYPTHIDTFPSSHIVSCWS